MVSLQGAGGVAHLGLIALLAAGNVQAEPIYKCRSAAGTASYSARPCPPGAALEKQLDDPVVPPASAAPAAPAPSATQPERRPAADGDGTREPAPSREDMREARARAAAEEERAAAEKARQAEMRKRSNECVHIRARLPMGYWADQGCM